MARQRKLAQEDEFAQKRAQIRTRTLGTAGDGATKMGEVQTDAVKIMRSLGLSEEEIEANLSPGQEAELEAQQAAAPRLVAPNGQPATFKKEKLINRVREQIAARTRDVQQAPHEQTQPENTVLELTKFSYNSLVKDGYSPAEAVELSKTYAMLELANAVISLAAKFGV